MVGIKTEARLTPNRIRMISEIRENLNITSSQLANILGISTSAKKKKISCLKKNGCIEKNGSNESGYWKVKGWQQISIFSDRIEILSHGGLAKDQDEDGFYSGASIPVNEVLASIFLQLRLSERSGRGVPKIVSKYNVAKNNSSVIWIKLVPRKTSRNNQN